MKIPFHAKTIKSCSLPYAWQEAVLYVAKSPQDITFGGGSEIKHAHDSQVSILLDNNAIQDALNFRVHPSDPFCSDKNGNPSIERIKAYIKEYEESYDASKFSYTYYNELTKGFYNESLNDFGSKYLNLIKKLQYGLDFQISSNLPSNRNVVTLLNNTKWDMLSSLPCWNMLGIRLEYIDSEGTPWVSISTWYRSHDLTDAWESNFIAQVHFIIRDILEPLNAKILYWHEDNASLHIYNHNLDIAKSLKIISVSPQLSQLQKLYNSE